MRAELNEQVELLSRLCAEYGEAVNRQAGATDEEIAATEEATGIQFDDDLRALYRFSNGGEYAQTWFGLDLQPFRFLTLDEVRDFIADKSGDYPGWDNAGEPWDQRIKRYHHHTKWLPFADFGNGNSLIYFDADPTAEGQYGQIIRFQHDPDEIMYVGADLVEFLRLSNQDIAENYEELWFERYET